MTIEVQPFGAPAQQSRAAAADAPGDGRTLTLSLRLGGRGGALAMAGRLSMRTLHTVAPGTQHARIARHQGAPLTITFRPESGA